MPPIALIMCSDISSFINQNKWDYTTSFIKLWKKYDVLNYNLCETTCKCLTDNNKYIDKNKELEKNIGKELIDQIKTTTHTVFDIQKNIKKTNEIINELIIPEKEKEELQENVLSVVNTCHGINNENSALELYEKQKNVVLDKIQQTQKIKIYQTELFEWFLIGKVDGKLLKDNSLEKIIEVKTRSYCFFKNVREYENTQIQMYMHLFNISLADLVEYYGSKIKITEIQKNQKIIDTILSNLVIFITEFEKFIKVSFEEKLLFYKMSDIDKKEFLSEMYLEKMHENSI